MAEITLREYLDFIEQRFNKEAFKEVAAHCRHILETYPKFIDVYRMLARALLEQEEFQDALDMFQRVLSADPNDFISHIGMSDCYRESGAIDQAIWHLERAFEQVPNNEEVEEAIKQLYAMRGSGPAARVPRKIQLTGGALARLYAKGNLFDQAVPELRQAIANDPERLDLQVLLADTLWRADEPVKAGKVAAEVLQRLPNSIDANRILSQLWLRAGQESEARPFVERVRELDPYLAYAIEHLGQEAPNNVFTLTQLEYDAAADAMQSGAGWISDIAIEKRKGVTGTLGPLPDDGKPSTRELKREQETPDWLKAALAEEPTTSKPEADDFAAGDLAALLGISETTSPPVPTSDLSSPESGLPDWLAGTPQISDVDTGELPDWLKDAPDTDSLPALTSEEAPSDEGLPDWLKDAPDTDSLPALASDAPSSKSVPSSQDKPDWLKDTLQEETGPNISVPELKEDPPDWLKDTVDIIPPTESDSSDSEGVVQSNELPDWLREEPETQFPTQSEAQPPTSIGTPPTAPEEEDQMVPDDMSDDIPDWMAEGDLDSEDGALAWLEELAAKYDPDFEKTTDSGDDESEDSDVDDTVVMKRSEMTPPEEVVEDTPTTPLPAAADDDLPDWLSEMETVPSGDDSSDDDELDWLRPPSEEPAAEAAPASSADDLPDWLTDTAEMEAPTPAAASDDDDALAWLDKEVKGQGADPSAVVSEELEKDLPPTEGAALPDLDAVAEEPDDTELPDWLKEASEAAEASGAIRDTDEFEGLTDDIEFDTEEDLDWLSDALIEDEGEPVAALDSAIDLESLLDDDDKEEEKPLPALASAPAPADEDDDLPDWLKEEPGEPAASQPATSDDLPDWLGVSSGDVPAKAAEDDLPPWMQKEGEPEAAPASAPEPVAVEGSDDDLPDWLSGLDDSAATPEPATAAADDDLPDWLTDTDEEEEAAEPVAVEASDDDLPDWLTDSDEDEAKPDEVDVALAAAPAVAEAVSISDSDEEDLPEWLRGLDEGAESEAKEEAETKPGTGQLYAPAVEIEDDELPDWLSEEDEGVEEEPAQPEPEPVAEAPAEEEPKKKTGSLTGWLSAVEPAEPIEELEEAEATPVPTPVAADAPVEQVAAAALPGAELQDYGKWLEEGRVQLKEKNIDVGLSAYESLVNSGQMLHETIDDLTKFLREQTIDHPRARRIVGDAFLAQGQLQEALDMYRNALDVL